MKKIILAAMLFALTSIVHAAPEVFGIIEMNVEVSDGYGAENSTDMDSGDSLIGFKGLETLEDDFRLAYFITIGVDSEGTEGGAEIVDASVALNHPKYGTVTLGLFESFMRIQSSRTVDIFEAGDGQGTTFDGRYDNATSYTSPTYGGLKFGVTVASDGPQGEKDVDVSEYVVVYSGTTFYSTAVHLDDKKVDVQNTFGAIKFTSGAVTYVAGMESVNNNTPQPTMDTIMLGVTVHDYKNAYKFGTSSSKGRGDTLTTEFSRMLGKNTTASVNIQMFDSDAPNEDTEVLAFGIRHDF